MIPLFASIAIAGGFAALIGLLVGGRRAQPVLQEGVGITAPPAGGSTPERRALTGILRERAPKGYLAMLDRRLALAGRPVSMSIDRILVGKTVLTVVGVLVALWWISGDPSPMRVGLGLFFLVLCFFTPELLLYSRGQERQEKIQDALADTLDQMTISVEAGLGFEAAMAKAATNGRGPLAEEFIRTLQDMSIGRARKDAYQAFGDRTSSPDLRRFTRAVVQADTYGIAIANVLRVQAGEMRLRRRQRAEEQAMKIPVKVLFPLVFCILPVLFIVLLTPAALRMIEAFS